MTADNRVVLDYTNRDYKSIRAMLVGLAKGFLPDWDTVGETGDFGTLLLELFAYNGDIANYYIDRVGAEAFLGTAIRRQSVMYIANMLGYSPIGQQAATVPLAFSWQWDGGSSQISQTFYRITQAKIENGVVSVYLTNADTAVSLEVGQAISISPSTDFFTSTLSGAYVVDSITPATVSTPFTASFLLSEDQRNTLAEYPWAYVGPGATLMTGTVVIIPKGTVVSSTSDSLGQAVVFQLDSDVLLDSRVATQVPTPGYVGNTDPSTVFSVTATGTATEGATVNPTSIGVSKGIPNTDLVLKDVGVIDRSVSVTTKEGGAAIVWGRVDNLAMTGPDQSVYSYYTDDKGLTHILFGDNASGRIPPTSAEIFVGYRVGVGARANNLEIGAVTSLSFDYATGVGVSVANTAVPSGGSDIESIDSMRFSIPRATAIKGRAISVDDYKALALQVPGVSKAMAYGDSYTAVFIRIAGSSESRGYITDRIPFSYTDKGAYKAVTAEDHSDNLHPGDKVFLSTQSVTGSYTVAKVWQAQPTILTQVSARELLILDPAVYLDIQTPQSVARITCTSPHGLVPGQPVKVEGVGAPFDGTWIVGTVPDPERTQFTYQCSPATQPDPAIDATMGNYDTAISLQSVPTGTASASAFSGIEVQLPLLADGVSNVPNIPYHPTGVPSPTDPPNLSFTDPLASTLIASVESYLADKSVVGAVVYGEPVEWADVTVAVQVTAQPLYNRTSVKDAVKAAIYAVFQYENVDFGDRITLGAVYRAALNVDGVEFVNISELHLSDDGSSGAADIVPSDKAIPRIDPILATDTTWITATGGLVNT
jgi:uncharacterized phage protein gp47/JayE